LNYNSTLAKRKSVGSATAPITASCSQFIADFLQFEQRNFQKGKMRPQ
jgi:hypothetical protein